MIDIEKEWEQAKYEIDQKKRKPTTRALVLKWMGRNKHRTWVWSWEFIGERVGDTILSYKAPARASDLAIYHPDLVECRKHKRFAAFRLKTENKHMFAAKTIEDLLEESLVKEIQHYDDEI